MTTFRSSAASEMTQWGRAVLGCLLEEPELWPEAAHLSSEHFIGSYEQKIFGAIRDLHERKRDADITSVLVHLGDAVPPDYVSGLIDGVVRPRFGTYVLRLREAGHEREFGHVLERLMAATSRDERRELLPQLQATLDSPGAAPGWRSLFHSYDEVVNAPPARFAIDGFLQEEGITLIGGLAGHGKTLCMLAMVRALLEGGKLFNYFEVSVKAERVIYLIPEAGLGPFSARLKTFHLQEHVKAGRLFCRTLSAQGQVTLTDARLLEAVKGADVFLDTAIRFMDGAEDAESSKVFADTLFGLQRAGARTICGAHHSPKSFGKDNFMTLENVLRGSGDIGAMLATCWGLSQIDAASNRIFVQNVKARDFLPCEPFIIQGRPSIDERGYFDLTEPPEFAGDLSQHKERKTGRPEITDKQQKAVQARDMQAQGRGYRDIAKVLGISKSKVGQLLNETSILGQDDSFR